MLMLGGCGRPVLPAADLSEGPSRQSSSSDVEGATPTTFAPPPAAPLADAPVPAPMPAPAPMESTPPAGGPAIPEEIGSTGAAEVAQPKGAEALGGSAQATAAAPAAFDAAASSTSAPSVKGSDLLTVIAPTDAMVVPAGSFIGELQTAPGVSSALVILDNHDPRIVTTDATELKGIAPGPHLFRAAPLDSVGALYPLPGALTARTFTVGSAAVKLPGFKADGPILTVGRPFGKAPPEADGNVPFDVRVDFVNLAPGGAVLRWQVDGKGGGSLEQWPPPHRLGLGPIGPGPHKLTAWLEDKGQKLDNAGYARVERDFVVEAR
jgi:hypothetical protein